MILVGLKNWKQEYRKGKHKKVWIVVKANNYDVYLENFDDWLDFKKRHAESGIKIHSIGLQYKSHKVEQDAENAEGVYLIRSAKGSMGAETIDTYTTGIINNGKVKKIMWSIPALIPESEFEDDIENCFEEAIIRNGEKGKTNSI